MNGPLLAPWDSLWWPRVIETAERNGHSEAEIVEAFRDGHAVGWDVGEGYLILARTEDDALLVWIGVGRGVRKWSDEATREVVAFSRAIGCDRLRITGRKGWQRVLPHWTRVGDDLELRHG